MVAKFINDKLQKLDFALKLFYVDDLLLIADFDTLSVAIKIITELEDLTGIEINLEKTTLHCPNDKLYKRAKNLFGSLIKIVNTMNLTYLKCPIGDDEFVKKHLEAKLKELRRTTKTAWRDALPT